MPPLTPETILKQTFGYEQFKPLQREVIRNVLDRRDTLAVMPTGGGKSLCYQIPALIFPGLTVVVSPLIALMKDQVEQLTQLGVPALFLNSSLSYEEYEANMARVVNGQVKLLYVAPETLLTARLYGLLGDGVPRLPDHRRSALHLGMGPRFPSRIPPAGGGAQTLPQGGLPGPDRYRHPARPGRHQIYPGV